MKTSEAKVKSLQKAIEILNCFTKKSTLGVTEISEMLGLYKSNVHSILNTYKVMDYLEQDEDSGKYRLGTGVFSLCRALGESFSIKQIAMPYMQELSNDTNERVYLAIPSEDEVIYLESMYPAESSHLMRTIMGERAKMYCTGIGKAILAHLPEGTMEDYISRELIPFTENTITDKVILKEELSNIKEQGYAIDNMEHEFGIKCIAMPVLNQKGMVEAAVSISGPSLRFEEERIKELVPLLKKAVMKIQERL